MITCNSIAQIIIASVVLVAAQLSAQQTGAPSSVNANADNNGAARADLQPAYSGCRIHEYETTKQIAFDATIDALKESGFVIGLTDFEKGHISGEKEHADPLLKILSGSSSQISVGVIVTTSASNSTRIQMSFEYFIAQSPAMNIVSDADLFGAMLCDEVFERLNKEL